MQNFTQRLLWGMLILSISSIAFSKNTILILQKRWAVVNYSLKGDLQKKAFKKLITTADNFSNKNKNDAKRLIWSGIIKSSYAGAIGGLSALSYAKDAKKDLEKALALDEKSLAGSAHTSLATLYSKVPGWPIGFGSDKKAAQHFKKALQLNPEGIDPNYFYAEFLYDEKNKYKEAKKYLLKAENAKPRENRPLADKERHTEIAALLVKVAKKLKRKKRR